MNNRAIWRRAAAQGFGGPGIALASSFFALGAFSSDAGLALWESMLCTIIIFALPGQLAAVELYARDSGLALIAISVLLVNLRLLPMTIALLPLLRVPRRRWYDFIGDYTPRRHWHDFIAAHFIAVTSWVCFIGTYPQIAAAARYRYFVRMGLLFWSCGIVATALGHWAASELPLWLLGGLLFLNPIYFLCMMLRSLRRRAEVAAFVFGLILLLPLHAFVGQWDIIIAGIIGGGAAFVIFGRMPNRASGG